MVKTTTSSKNIVNVVRQNPVTIFAAITILVMVALLMFSLIG